MLLTSPHSSEVLQVLRRRCLGMQGCLYESVRTKGAGACQLSAEQNEPTVQLQLGGWHFQNRQTAKSARDCSLIMFNLRVYNTGTTSSKFIISSQHLHTGQTGPTCPQLGPNLDTQLGPKLGPTRANIPDPTRSAENTLLPPLIVPKHAQVAPWRTHVGPKLAPTLEPSGPSWAQVKPELG
jgi:hypothetical protein